MDISEAFAPASTGPDETQLAVSSIKSEYLDFPMSPSMHAAEASGSDDPSGPDTDFLHRPNSCHRQQATSLSSFLSEACAHHDPTSPVGAGGNGAGLFNVKEANNNTLTALPPVSTITGSLAHLAHHTRLVARTTGADQNLATVEIAGLGQVTAEGSYWVSEETKNQPISSILLEDLGKFCWPSDDPDEYNPEDHEHLLIRRADAMLTDDAGPGAGHRHQSARSHCINTSDRQNNTDGAIYTLTVLKSEPNSMDGLECCKSPTPGQSNDNSWTLRQNGLDFDAILNMDTSTGLGGSGELENGDLAHHHHDRHQHQHHQQHHHHHHHHHQMDQYTTATTLPSSQFGTDSADPLQSDYTTVVIKTEPGNGSGDNNNDWKLSDRNSLEDGSGVSVAADSSADSLLRNALQGKLFANPVVTTAALSAAGGATILVDAHSQIGGGQDEQMQTCTEEELLLSSLDVVDASAYRTNATGDFEKLKCIPNEVVETYCNLESVCNVGATTVMYTIDPDSGNLGTITLPADLSQMQAMGIVVTASSLSPELLQAEPLCTVQPGITLATPQQPQQPSPTDMQHLITKTDAPKKSKSKKYVRRSKSNATATNGSTSSQPGVVGSTSTNGNPAPRKERSLHYCTICSKGFKDKYSVNVHIRTHTGEKPFACTHCGKRFRQKAHLAKHHQTHNPPKTNVSGGSASSAGSNSSRGASSPPTPAQTPVQVQAMSPPMHQQMQPQMILPDTTDPSIIVPSPS